MSFTVRRAGVDDALELTRTLQVAQAYTYAAIMPVQFAIDRIAEIDEAARERRTQLDEGLRAEAAGQEPFRRWWVAEDAEGIVGVAATGRRPSDWEQWFRPPPTPFHLDKLYVLPRGHGSGVGQALFDASVPAGEPAYLWILEGNPRAARFYRRNGFVDEGYAADSGEKWFVRPMFRMVRGVPDSSAR